MADDPPVGFNYSLFDKQAVELFGGVREIRKANETENSNGSRTASENAHREANDENVQVVRKSGRSCLICGIVQFETLETQRDHFKLDWHRFNVKQKLMSKQVLSEEQFEEVSGELSSISGSDTSDNEDDPDTSLESTHHVVTSALTTDQHEMPATNYRHHPKLILTNQNDTVFTLYRAVVYSARFLPENNEDLDQKIRDVVDKKVWLVVMTAGGHFASAVFDGNEVIAHKTFHRYTVRAKRGTAQGLRDQQGKMPKSAGATLRRYNEAALNQDVQDLLNSWSDHLSRCHCIFIRVPTYGQAMFYGGKKPPFRKDDPRIRTIPFATRRPTFNEVKRVHDQLSRITIIGNSNDVTMEKILCEMSPQPKSPFCTSPPRATETEKETTVEKTVDQCNDENETSDGEEQVHCVTDNPEDRPNSGPRRKIKQNTNKTRKARNKQDKHIEHTEPTPERLVWNRLHCAIVAGNTDIVHEVLATIRTRNCTSNLPCRNSNETLLEAQTNVKSSITEDNALLSSTTQTGSHYEKPCLDSLELEDATETERISETISTQDADELNITEQELGSEDITGIPDMVVIINEKWGAGSSTLLHAAAARASPAGLVYSLLRMGANPVIRDTRGRTSYDAAESKETRNEFRRFMADFPDRYDYNKAHIPSPLTQGQQDEQEKKEAEKKKVQRKARKQRNKEKKIVEQTKLEEEKERERLSKLSDRERRALAAERRLAQQQPISDSGTQESCAMCSRSLTGRVPFERLSYKYCNTLCVREHRLLLESKDKPG